MGWGRNIGDVVMNRNLLILGADRYGLAARETAQAMGCFENIAFLDDRTEEMPDGSKILGKLNEFKNFASEYSYIFAAIANPEIKLDLLKKIKEITPYKIATLVSPRAYVSPTAQIMEGSMVEAMAVVNTGTVISVGCIIEAGCVVNHCSMCCDGVHMACNATVADNTLVPTGTFIDSGVVYKGDNMDVNDLFFEAEKRCYAARKECED